MLPLVQSAGRMVTLKSICMLHMKQIAWSRCTYHSCSKLLNGSSCLNNNNTINYSWCNSDNGKNLLICRKRYASSDPHSQIDGASGLPVYVPGKGELAYFGVMRKSVKAVKIFSLSTSLLTLMMQPYLMITLSSVGTGMLAAIGTVMGLFTFGTPLMIHFIAKKYVSDLYYDEDTEVFVASTLSLFARRKELQFTADDVVYPTVPGMFTSVIIKGKPLFMDPYAFRLQSAYTKMMGYDKPLDWELPSLEDNKTENISPKEKSSHDKI